MSESNTPQPTPTPNEGVAVWELVISDMRERDQFGRHKYGTPLQVFNGRNPLVDAYQEVLDLAVYLRQEIEERKKMNAEISGLRLYSLTLRKILQDVRGFVSEELESRISSYLPNPTLEEEQQLKEARNALFAIESGLSREP